MKAYDLHESNERFKQFFHSSPDFCYMVSPNGEILDINKYALEVLGYKKEKIIGKQIIPTVYAPFDHDKAKRIVKKWLKNGKLRNEKLHIITSKGEVRNVILSTDNVIDKNGKLLYSILIQKDVTETVKAEEKIKESEQNYHNLLESSPDPIIIIDLKGNFIFANDACKKYSGYNKDEIIGKTAKKAPFITKESKELILKNIRNRFTKKKYLRSYNIDIKDKSGKIKTFEIHTSEIKKVKKIVNIMITLRDITEKIKFEQKLKKFNLELEEAVDKRTEELTRSNDELVRENLKRQLAEEELTMNAQKLMETIKELDATREELEEMNRDLEEKVKIRTDRISQLLKQKDDFIHQLGHDLKTPLSPILTILPLIKNDIKDDKSKEAVDVVINSAEYMKELILKNLELARLNSPNTKFDFEDLNLLEITENIILNNKTIFDESNIEIKNKIDKNIKIYADKLRIKELINNLLTNAVKYTTDEKGKIIINSKKKDGFVDISISDSGIGLDKNEIDHIFDEFFKADESRHDLDSSGLGLSICKKIVEKHNGKIWVESKGKGKGSTFHFSIKISDDR